MQIYNSVNFSLSITKWIHIHGGDKGLKSFFKKIHDSLKVGGVFVLEAQEFKTFQRRAKHVDVKYLHDIQMKKLTILILALFRCGRGSSV